jgi:hypothetical protein
MRRSRPNGSARPPNADWPAPSRALVTWQPGRVGSPRRLRAEKPSRPGSRRDRLAVLLALATYICLGLAFLLGKGTQFLMPGPLASAHGAIENCSACHTKSGSGKFSWIHGLVAGDSLADSKACLTCHKMPNTAFNAHSASEEMLKRSTDRLIKVAATTPAPPSARAQTIAFPTNDIVAGGLYCATCHQEHKGVNFNLAKISNEQCRSCHVVKFDSFDGNHPKFDGYPFKRRTRIIYDHAGHFGKHFPEMEKKNPTLGIPSTCSSCHNSRADRRVMAVAPFDQTCTACHLDQIIGKERASGPKGVAFLSLPGLDLQTLKEKNADIGEWPEASEAPLTPFMKVMISRSEKGRALIKTVDSLNLQDLGNANKEQIKAVTKLAWEIKGLFFKLISGKASDILADLNVGSGKLNANLIADLTASIPRDVIISAHQQWLPNLATEMANHKDVVDEKPSGWGATIDEKPSGWGATITESKLSGSISPEELAGLDAREATPRLSQQATGSDAASFARTIRLAQTNQQTQSKNAPGAVATKAKTAQPEAAVEKTDTPSTKPDNNAPASAKPDNAKEAPAAADPPPAKGADQTDDLLNPTEEEIRGGAAPAKDATQPEASAPKAPAASAKPAATAAASAKPDAAKETPSAAAPPPRAAGDQDDLLYPTEEEAKAAGITPAARPAGGAPEATSSTNAPSNSAADSVPDTATPAASDNAAAEPQTKAAAPVVAIQSDVDPESWAEYGGWYRQDYALFYRPTGHKDKFIYSWLFLTGPKAPKGTKSPAASVFDYLTSKDAQGSCTKCHSVDDLQGKGRLVNFSPPKPETKQGRFTNFVHEPHFGILETRGCLTCHNLEKDRPYLKSFEQGNPQNFASNFGGVKKDLCQTCHTSSAARQDCLLCHKYHVNGVITPIMSTKLPTQ